MTNLDRTRRLATSIFLVAVSLAATGLASAQDFPKRRLSITVPYPPGGATDVAARVIADQLQASLGQPVIVENRAGGNTTIATRFIMNQPPDGYNLYIASRQLVSTPVATPEVLDYAPHRDLTSIGFVANMPYVLVVNSKVPAKTFGELIEYSKKKPGGVTLATTGSGSGVHLLGLALQQKTGARFTFVPYRGTAPLTQDLVGGSVDATINVMATLEQHVKSGALTLIASGEKARSPATHNVPTFAETAPGFEMYEYFQLVGPKDMPRDLVLLLNKRLNDVLKSEATAQRFNGIGIAPMTSTPDELNKSLRDDFEGKRRMVTELNLKFE